LTLFDFQFFLNSFLVIPNLKPFNSTIEEFATFANVLNKKPIINPLMNLF